MPTSVKLFYLLGCAMAGWILFQAVQHVFFPSPDYQAGLASLPLEQRVMARAADHRGWAIAAARSIILFVLASIIVFGRQNWARWLLALLIVAKYVIPALWFFSDVPINAAILTIFWKTYVVWAWSEAVDFLWLGLWALLVILIFLPNAQPWFRKPVAA